MKKRLIPSSRHSETRTTTSTWLARPLPLNIPSTNWTNCQHFLPKSITCIRQINLNTIRRHQLRCRTRPTPFRQRPRPVIPWPRARSTRATSSSCHPHHWNTLERNKRILMEENLSRTKQHYSALSLICPPFYPR